MKRFRNHFISGLLVLGPLYLSIIFLGYLIRLTDHFVVNPFFALLPFQVEASFKVVATKLALALFIICFVSVVGWLAERFIFKKIFSDFEGILKNIPIFSNVYSSIREIIQAFFGDKRGIFRRVVYVEYPRKGVWAIAFVTQEKPWEIGAKTGRPMVNVLVPSPPNPATGFFIMVPCDEIIESSMTVEEGIRLVISAGAAVPK